jgi:hypothetical protein
MKAEDAWKLSDVDKTGHKQGLPALLGYKL